MKNVACLFFLICFAICQTATAQIRNGEVSFNGSKIKYETVVVKDKANDYYIVFFENDPSASLKYLQKNKCLKENTCYYLMNISAMKLNDSEKNQLLGKFIDTIENDSKLSNAKSNILMNVDRIENNPSVKLVSGMHVW